MLFLQLVLRFVHIVAAMIMFGGAVYHRFAFRAGLEKVPAEQRDAIVEAVRPRWAMLVMMASGLLLISGMANFSLIVAWYKFPEGQFPGTIYHPLFGVKFLAALAVFFISSRLAGGSDAAQQFRGREKLWSSINLSLAILIILLAGLMKLADRTPRGQQSARSLQSTHSYVELSAPGELPRHVT